MSDLLQWLGSRPTAFWLSIVAVLVSAGSLLHTIRTAKFGRRLQAHEKRTEVLGLLTEAQFTTSQALARLRSHRARCAESRPGELPALDENIGDWEKIEKKLESDFMATLAASLDVPALESRRQDASIELASVRSVIEALDFIDTNLRAEGQDDGTA